MKKCLFLCLSLLLAPVLALCEPRAVLFTATDLHYIAPTLTDNGALFTDLIEQGDGKVMAYSDALIEAFVAAGGSSLQFNLIDRDLLIEAQKAPDEHRDVCVRVCGYSAVFVTLSDEIQTEIVARAIR